MPQRLRSDRDNTPSATERSAVHVAGRLVVGVDLLGPGAVTRVDISSGPRIDLADEAPVGEIGSVPELQMTAVARLAGLAATEATWGSEPALRAVIADLLQIVDLVDESIARTGDGLVRVDHVVAVRAWRDSGVAEDLANARRARFEDIARTAWGMVASQLDIMHEIAQAIVRDGTVDPHDVWSQLLDRARSREID